MSSEPRKDRRNMPLYLRVLCAVAREPKRASDVAAELRVGVNATHRILRLMRGRLVYVTDYTKSGRGRPVARWMLGTEPDAPKPAAVAAFDAQITTHAVRAEMSSFLVLMEAMLREPQSMRRLQDMTGCGRDTVLNLIRIGREAKVIHIAEYDRERVNGAYAICYAIGVDKPDAKKPRPVPRSVVEARYRAGRYAKNRQARIVHALAANANVFNQAA